MSELERIVENVAIEAWHEGTQRHDVARHAAIEAVKRCASLLRGYYLIDGNGEAEDWTATEQLLQVFPEAKEKSDDS